MCTVGGDLLSHVGRGDAVSSELLVDQAGFCARWSRFSDRNLPAARDADHRSWQEMLRGWSPIQPRAIPATGGLLRLTARSALGWSGRLCLRKRPLRQPPVPSCRNGRPWPPGANPPTPVAVINRMSIIDGRSGGGARRRSRMWKRTEALRSGGVVCQGALLRGYPATAEVAAPEPAPRARGHGLGST